MIIFLIIAGKLVNFMTAIFLNCQVNTLLIHVIKNNKQLRPEGQGIYPSHTIKVIHLEKPF